MLYPQWLNLAPDLRATNTREPSGRMENNTFIPDMIEIGHVFRLTGRIPLFLRNFIIFMVYLTACWWIVTWHHSNGLVHISSNNRNFVVVIRERYANRVSLFSIHNRNGFEEDIDEVLVCFYCPWEFFGRDVMGVLNALKVALDVIIPNKRERLKSQVAMQEKVVRVAEEEEIAVNPVLKEAKHSDDMGAQSVETKTSCFR
ncbi:hypothetical protein OUZ56_001650 [Daphnia magna]|uniref:Uncharacterized protein n=1 Tax=Daphnia magna TaxID=35525 RepID=A0ABR0A3B3_9CRUS|nr:hypothetical protein OUZ56_001650 [Daphnia magna]